MIGRVLILAGLAAVAVIAVSWTFVRWRGRAIASQVKRCEQRLDHADPRVRIDSARGLLRVDPTRPQAALVLARTLVEVGQWAEARGVLEDLKEAGPVSIRTEALSVYAQSYLSEAADWIARNSTGKLDTSGDQVQSLLTKADRITSNLEQMTGTEGVVTRLKATDAHCQAALVRLMLMEKRVQLTKAQATDSNDRTAAIVAAISQLTQRLGGLERQVAQLSRKLVTLQPADPVGWELLFQGYVDARAFDHARQTAKEVTELSEVDAALAGKIANTLLNLNSLFAHPTVPEDLDIAGRLLSHHLVKGTDHIDYRTAQISLALHQSQYRLAEELANGVLQDYPGHGRATCLLGIALIQQGHGKKAIAQLSFLNDRVRSAQVKFILAAAMLSQEMTDSGREMLRQSLDLRPDNLPALVMLAGSLANDGYILEAEQDIIAAAGLNPLHPSVIKLSIQLLVAQMDRPGIWQILDDPDHARLSPVRWQDVAVAVAMVLDDTAAVSRLVAQRLRSDPGHVRMWLADHWCRAPSQHRFDLATLLVRYLLERLDTDPLAQPNPPRVPVVVDQSSSGDLSNPLNPFYTTIYVPSGYQMGLELIDAALRRWPDKPALLDLAARLSLWDGQDRRAAHYLAKLGRTGAGRSATAVAVQAHLEDVGRSSQSPSNVESSYKTITCDTPTCRLVMLLVALNQGNRQVAEAHLTRMLSELAWAEPPLIFAIRDALERGEPEQAWAWLAIAEKINPAVATLARARLNLSMGQPIESVHDLKSLLRSEDVNSELSRMAVDVLSRAGIAMGQVQVGISMIENLALSVQFQDRELRLAVVDVLLAAGQTTVAIAALKVMFNEQAIPARWLDRLLVRAYAMMGPVRTHQLVEVLLERQPKEPLLLLYKARCTAEAGDLTGADAQLDAIREVRPHAPRLLMTMARSAAAQGRWGDARRLCHQLIQRGGDGSEAAQRELSQWDESSELEKATR